MTHKYKSLFLERKTVFFAGPETPSEASSYEVKQKESQESVLPHADTIVFDGWDGFRNSSTDREKNSSASAVSDLLKSGKLGVIVPDGTEIFPRAGLDAKGEVPLGNGMILSYERGVIDTAGTSVDVTVKFSEVPLPGDVLRGTFKNGPVKQPREVGKEFEYDSWKEFKDWVGKDGSGHVNASIFDMFADKDITFVLPDGKDYRPVVTGTQYEGSYDEELSWPDGYTFSYEKGLLAADGTPVEGKIRSVKIYPSQKEFDRQTVEWLKKAPAIRLKAEASQLRDRIDTRLAFADQSRRMADGLMELHADTRYLLEAGKVEEAAKKMEDISQYLWDASQVERKRERDTDALRASGALTPDADIDALLSPTGKKPRTPYYYQNKYELQYSAKGVRNDDGTPSEEGVIAVLAEIDRDALAISKDYKRQEIDAQAHMKRYELLRAELSSRNDLADEPRDWYKESKEKLDRP